MLGWEVMYGGIGGIGYKKTANPFGSESRLAALLAFAP